MAELFERHDRGRFELVGISYGPDNRDEMRIRLSAAFDHFVDVRTKTDSEVAALSRDLGIDIAVDLKGFTEEARTGIFSRRAAPIQVNYLGYPGTMAAPYMDYIVADPILIPPESRQHYAEKIVYLPDSYQVNDRKRRISDKEFTRAELGLPPTGFVFCCFNNNFKITPNTFNGWMRILKQVEGSVLWLLEDNETAANNLRREAEARGVEPARLVFARRMPLPEHLARHRAADLFIDTLPYNAHTTASDALWAGLPVLTRIGESFAGRVAASLLNAVGLPELITATQEQYEAMAVALALHFGVALVHIFGSLALVLRHRLSSGDQTSPEDVVRDDDSARSELRYEDLEVARVLFLHAVDVGKVDRPIDLFELGDGGALSHFDLLLEPRLLDEAARCEHVTVGQLDRDDPRCRPRRTREDDRAVTDVRPELDDELGRARGDRDGEERRDLRIADGQKQHN